MDIGKALKLLELNWWLIYQVTCPHEGWLKRWVEEHNQVLLIGIDGIGVDIEQEGGPKAGERYNQEILHN